MPRTPLRYAIEKMPKEMRKQARLIYLQRPPFNPVVLAESAFKIHPLEPRVGVFAQITGNHDEFLRKFAPTTVCYLNAAMAQGYQTVICGHTHVPKKKKLL